MEEKLKKQRNKLFLRIILIMAAIWLIISAVFFAVRIITEKTNVQSEELAKLSDFRTLMSVGSVNVNDIHRALSDYVHYDGSSGNNGQLIVVDMATEKTIMNSLNSVSVQFSLKYRQDSTSYAVAMINYYTVKDALTDEEFAEIKEKLTEEQNDGCYYELICTKLHITAWEFIPLEIKLVLVNGEDSRFVSDDDAYVYDLSENIVEGMNIVESSEIHRNVIPKELIIGEPNERDLIGELTKEQRRSPVAMIPTGLFQYIFYSSEYLMVYDPDIGTYGDESVMQFAKEVNTLKNCRKDLAVGFGLIFLFFFTIAAILCVMIWNTVRAQIIQEQKRIDLTNALAHDIKTPLFVISGYAYILKEKIDENERDMYIDKIIEQTNTVNGLVHKMLDFSKLDSYNMKLDKKELDLCKTVSDRLSDYTALPDNKKIIFTHSGENTILADEGLLKTVLQNLIDNSVKYSLPESEIVIDVSDKTLSVSNKSEPMTKAEIKELWEPYVRRDKSRSRNGNGLGLSIVKSILDLHEAKYHADMKDDIFTVTIVFKA